MRGPVRLPIDAAASENTCLLGADKLRLPTRLHALNNLDLWKWKNHFPSLRKELLLTCHNTIFKMPG